MSTRPAGPAVTQTGPLPSCPHGEAVARRTSGWEHISDNRPCAPGSTTAEQLYVQLDERRRALGLAWWEVALAMDVCAVSTLRRMAYGACSPELADRVRAWLDERMR